MMASFSVSVLLGLSGRLTLALTGATAVDHEEHVFLPAPRSSAWLDDPHFRVYVSG